MKKSITVASLVMGVGAIVVVIFSFLDFFSFGDSDGFNAWDGDGLFPATIIPVILAVATIVLIVLDLVGVKLPDKVLTFTWPQIYATWGISAAGIMLGWLFTGPAGTDKGAGLILMLIGSLAMAAGSIMGLLGVGTNTLSMPTGSAPSTPAAPPPPGGFPPQAPGFPPQAPPPPPPGGSAPPPPPPV